MNISRCPNSIGIHYLMVILFVALVPYRALAFESSLELPANASALKYGNGWKCDQGYREVNKRCIAIKTPANAYLTHKSYGQGWECKWGYRELDKSCVAINVPQHGYLTDSSSGPSWKCERGYRAVGKECVAIKVPA
ncbi:MAG: hypothetical protein K1566_19970, partial [Candidatus Thiodiazotropha sp. (ex. Lucinisca nassula)]|nr:hypothetical protein [Candidatus Thiodiazotropha sp. (ex. Lucinisca nassula)]